MLLRKKLKGFKWLNILLLELSQNEIENISWFYLLVIYLLFNKIFIRMIVNNVSNRRGYLREFYSKKF